MDRAKSDAIFLVTYGSDYLRDDLRAVDNMLAEEYYSVVDAWISNKNAEAKAYEEAEKKMK